jgi:translation initiation factor IF-2
MVAGAGCPVTANAGAFARYRAGSAVKLLAGGFAGAGCAGWFWSVPMSGSATTDDPDTYVLWYFSTVPLSSGHCEIWVFVAQGSAPSDVAGKPTTYEVLRGRNDQRQTASFTVDQTANRGQWVDAGSFAFSGGQLAVKMVNRGSGAGGDRHAAAQLMPRCGA